MKLAAYNPNWDSFIIGDSPIDLLSQCCKWEFQGCCLVAKFLHYNQEKMISFSDEYSDAELINKAVKYLFERLKNYGWIVYKKID